MPTSSQLLIHCFLKSRLGFDAESQLWIKSFCWPKTSTIFRAKKKAGAVFVNLTAAYDTVWYHGLTCKLVGVSLPRTVWVQLNRLRTCVGWRNSILPQPNHCQHLIGAIQQPGVVNGPSPVYVILGVDARPNEDGDINKTLISILIYKLVLTFWFAFLNVAIKI